MVPPVGLVTFAAPKMVQFYERWDSTSDDGSWDKNIFRFSFAKTGIRASLDKAVGVGEAM